MSRIPLTVDKNSPTPIYYQLKEQLALLIRNGTFPVDSQLPTELSISQALEISRGTVRQAINALVAEGRLYRVQGSGTFVSEPPAALHLAQRFSSFAEDMRDMNIPFSSKVLVGRVIRAEGRLLSKLGLTYSDRVIYLERLGWANSEPFVLAFSYLPESICPDLLDEDLTDRPLYEILEASYGLRLATATRTLEASLADEYEAKLLQIPEGSPIHFMHSLAFLDDGRPIEYARLRFRGERSRITFEVKR
ncbi:MAG: GntR family transcriptional regulator [Anaerolineae bacterium]|nr:GntR family transcriptional regulator [Anaerolineae bacterium]